MKKKSPLGKFIYILIIISFIFYLCMLFYYALGSSRAAEVLQGQSLGSQHLSSLEPFHTIKHYWYLLWNYPSMRQVALLNLVGNVILVLPLAIYYPFFFKPMRKFYTTIPAVLGVILFIETAQYITGLGSFDVDDIILNAAGALLGYLIWKLPLLQKITKDLSR